MEYLVIGTYVFSLTFILLFSLVQLHLTLKYRKSKRNQAEAPKPQEELPQVTVQLPIYNELYVSERLIRCISAFDYPKDKLEIQVLDDSTDETVEVIRRVVDDIRKNQGLDIHHIRRSQRSGFKAGALQYGLSLSKGEYIAIFDADFLPEKDFLRQTLPFFRDRETGVVQTRWGHLNEEYSALTRFQAFGLNAHFSIEQSGRHVSGSFINFNGTAGVWRKSCIEDAGGWSFDTLTEDLDLSYRAQLRGWKFKYLEDVVSPAELPVLIPAIKSQQFRWNKGAAETARKNLFNVYRAMLPARGKIHATFHLLSSSVFAFMLLAGIMSIPMLFIKANNPHLIWLFHAGSVFLIGFASITFFYWTSFRNCQKEKPKLYFLKIYPMFLSMSMGLSLHNALAVFEGLTGLKSDFIRTPKFNIISKTDQWTGNKYVRPRFSWMTVFEGLLGIYFILGVAAGIYLEDYGLILFHVMLAIGFSSICYHSIKTFRFG